MRGKEITDMGVRRVLTHMGGDLYPGQWAKILGETRRDIEKTLKVMHWERIGVRQHAVMKLVAKRAAYAPDLAESLGMELKTMHEVLATLRRRDIVASTHVEGQRSKVYSLTAFGRSLLAME